MSAQLALLEPVQSVGTRSATFSDDGIYRYLLERAWEVPELGAMAQRRTILWVLLNPSTADAFQDDPTVRRITNYSRDWGFTDLRLVNLFGFRATKPAELWSQRAAGVDIIGPANDRSLFRAAWSASQVVVGWGAGAHRCPKRVVQVLELLEGSPAVAWSGNPVSCLGTTLDGHPRHPLYLRREEQLVPFERRG